ncbi:MAG: Cytochrome c oxidase polypeptide II, partial [uncultured Quadrisphaera sp.]
VPGAPPRRPQGGRPTAPAGARRPHRHRRRSAGPGAQRLRPADRRHPQRLPARHRRHVLDQRDRAQPLGGLVDRGARRRRHHLGPHHLVRRALPPAQGRHRPAPAAALQRAPRGALHGRPAAHGGRAVLLHGPRPAGHRGAVRGPRGEHRGRRQALGLGLQLPRRRGLRDHPPGRPRRRPHRRPDRGQHPDPVHARRAARRDHDPLARRQPLVLRARLQLQEGHDPRAHQLHVGDARGRGHLQGQVRRALRAVPPVDAVQRRGGLAGGVRHRDGGAARARPDRGPRGRPRPLGPQRRPHRGPGRRRRRRRGRPVM